MENASDAIKMAFGMLVLVGALALAMYSFTTARQTSSKITKEADNLEYYSTLSLEDIDSVNALSSREVGIETVIPTLYRYYKENYTVLFYIGKGYDKNTGNFASIEPMTLYYTEVTENYLPKSSLIDRKHNKSSGRAIFGFDKQDEQARNEPWNLNQQADYNFMKAFVNGNSTDKYYTSRKNSIWGGTYNTFSNDNDGNGPYYRINFQYNSFGSGRKGIIGQDYRFIERYGEYNYENTLKHDENTNTTTSITSNLTDSVVILDNNEIVVNRAGTTKRVIQYIYIAD